MKTLLKLFTTSLILIGMTACGQQTVGGNSNNNQNGSSKQVSQIAENGHNQVPVTLDRDVDGDTIKVFYNGKKTTVRMLLIDTPEDVKKNTCIQPYSLEAAQRTKKLVSSGKLTLEFDGNKTDKYGRLLAYVFVDGKSVQEDLLKNGYARVAYVYKNHYKYLEQFKTDETIAKSKKLRIWSKTGYVTDRGFMGCVH